MEFARVFWTSIAFIGGVVGLLWLFKPGVGDAPSNWTRFVNRFFQPAAELTSSDESRHEPFPNAGNRSSYAGNRLMEQLGTEAGNTVPFSVPALVKALTELSDDELLTVLAALPGESDDYRFADSRLAKFIGGRVEDRQNQVRELRGKELPLPPGRKMEIQQNGRRQVVSMD